VPLSQAPRGFRFSVFFGTVHEIKNKKINKIKGNESSQITRKTTTQANQEGEQSQSKHDEQNRITRDKNQRKGTASIQNKQLKTKKKVTSKTSLVQN
jgi:hypothetical protein